MALEPLLSNLLGSICIVGGPTDKRRALFEAAVARCASEPESVVATSSMAGALDWAHTQTGPVSIVAYLSLWHSSRGRGLADALSALPTGSRLFFVEPTAGVGAAHRVQSWGRAVFLKRLGLSFHVDVPAVLRLAEWAPTSVLRFSVGHPARLMTFVAGEARSSVGEIPT